MYRTEENAPMKATLVLLFFKNILYCKKRRKYPEPEFLKSLLGLGTEEE
jgi:hypothetical protein